MSVNTPSVPQPSDPASRSWGPTVDVLWSSGPWTLEVREDELSHIKYDGRPLLRGVRAVTRDRNWQTPSNRVDRVDIAANSLTLGLRIDDGGIEATGTLTAEVRDGHLQVDLDIEAGSTFMANRMGLTALLGADLQGTSLTVQHSDGRSTQTLLPERISPHQPVKDIRVLSWKTPSAHVTLQLSGDTFEMEDQRNWTDASYKIYSPPLDRGFPQIVNEGARHVERLIVSATSVDGPTTATAEETVVLRDHGRRFPAIGTSAYTGPDGPAPVLAPPAEFVLVELNTNAPNWRFALRRARRAHLPLDVRIIADHPEALDPVVRELEGIDVLRIGVFSASTHVTEAGLFRALEKLVEDSSLSAEVVGGTRAHFTELNRNHRELPALSALTFSITSQMHTKEGDHILETVPTQTRVMSDAAAISDGRPVHVGPITLRPRFNAVATTEPPAESDTLLAGYGAEHTPEATDPRQSDAETATWMVASAAALATGAPASLAYFEEYGPRGLARVNGEPFPVHRALVALRLFSGRPMFTQEDVGPLTWMWAVGAATHDGVDVLVANLTDLPRTATIELDGKRLSVPLSPLSWTIQHLVTDRT